MTGGRGFPSVSFLTGDTVVDSRHLLPHTECPPVPYGRDSRPSFPLYWCTKPSQWEITTGLYFVSSLHKRLNIVVRWKVTGN